MREIDEKVRNSLPFKKEEEEPLYVRSFKEKGMSYGLCLFLSLGVYWPIYLALIVCGVIFISFFVLFVNDSSLALNILSYTFLLSASLCWIGWPFPSALAIQKNKRVYTNMPLIHFYGDHFEFVGEALGKDKKSYGDVFISFPYAACKIIKSKKHRVLFYQYGEIKNVAPLSRADLPSSLDQAIVRASTK